MKVTVGDTGGIAAYKAAELVRALQQQALDVHVVMTGGSDAIRHPSDVRRIEPGITSLPAFGIATGQSSQIANSAIEHISEAQSNQALNIIAPATADILARLAHGMAE